MRYSTVSTGSARGGDAKRSRQQNISSDPCGVAKRGPAGFGVVVSGAVDHGAGTLNVPAKENSRIFNPTKIMF